MEREEFGHIFGIEPFLRAFAHDPATLFRMFLDDEFDEYIDIVYPTKTGDSIVKIRKPTPHFSPKMMELVFDYLKRKNKHLNREFIEQVVAEASLEDWYTKI